MAKPVSNAPGLHVVPLPLLIYFAIFYLLGYLLYSAMFAAVGAAFNSTDEAQHWTFVIISPLIFACTLITPVAAAPNSTLAVITSMIPFCAPVLMYMRLAVESSAGVADRSMLRVDDRRDLRRAKNRDPDLSRRDPDVRQAPQLRRSSDG